MKCKDCNCCQKGYWRSKPNAYVCIGVAEPFEIEDIYMDCTEYSEKREEAGCIYCREMHFVTNAVRIDKDDNPIYSNIETKFCPNCGRKLNRRLRCNC